MILENRRATINIFNAHDYQKRDFAKLISNLFQFFTFIVFFAFLFDIWRNSPSIILTHDVSDFIAESNQFLIDGTLYSSFFNINPPFLIFFYVIWGSLLGFGLFGLKTLNIILITAIFFIFYRILLKYGQKSFILIVFNIGVALAYTRNAFQMFLPSESIGTLMALVLLYLSLRGFEKLIWLVPVGILSALSMQTKEVYAFTILTPILVCLFYQKRRYVKLSVLLSSFLGTNLILMFLLYLFGELDSYLDVINLKSHSFRPSDWKNTLLTSVVMIHKQFQFFGEIFAVFCILLAILGFYKNRKNADVKFSDYSKRRSFFYFICTAVNWLAISIGIIWQRKDFTNGHVIITVLFPFLLFAYFGLAYLFNSLDFKGIQLNLSLLFMILPIIYTIYSNGNHLQTGITDQELNRNLRNYTLVKNLELSSNDCIQNAYGWMSGSAYLYTGMKPCSRYFLINLIVNDKSRLDEFRSTMVSHPPRAIIYDNSGADLNWKEFERKIFPYSIALKECYLNIEKSDVYLAKWPNNIQRECLKNIIRDN